MSHKWLHGAIYLTTQETNLLADVIKMTEGIVLPHACIASMMGLQVLPCAEDKINGSPNNRASEPARLRLEMRAEYRTVLGSSRSRHMPWSQTER